MLAYKVGFWSESISDFRNTPDNLTLVNMFYSGRLYLILVQGQFAAPLRCHPPPPPPPPPLAGLVGVVVTPLDMIWELLFVIECNEGT